MARWAPLGEDILVEEVRQRRAKAAGEVLRMPAHQAPAAARKERVFGGPKGSCRSLSERLWLSGPYEYTHLETM
jgi:hypothetical protein